MVQRRHGLRLPRCLARLRYHLTSTASSPAVISLKRNGIARPDCSAAIDLFNAKRLPGERGGSIGVNDIAATTFGYDKVAADGLNIHEVATLKSAAVLIYESKGFPWA